MRTLLCAILACGLLSSGCASTHELKPPPRLQLPNRSCTIGVAKFDEGRGVDHSIDLRDYLRQHGPCRHVLSVPDPNDSRADVVVSGTVDSKTYYQGGPVVMWGAVATGLGLGGLMVGGIFHLVASSPDPNEDQYTEESQQRDAESDQLFKDIGTGALYTGAGLTAVGIPMIIGGASKARLHGEVKADVQLWRGGELADRWTINDTFTVNADFPSSSPEDDFDSGGMGRSYREALTHVYAHVADKLGPAVQSKPGG